MLLLRQRGRLTAQVLAEELEVSTRTVLRDIEALSLAGVPLYAERGRHGGFSLLPGFRTELTGLNHDEALALLTAGGGGGNQLFGLGSALAAAMRKVVDALPESHQEVASHATQRILINPETDLLSRRLVTDAVPDPVMRELRGAVLGGRRLRIEYAAKNREPRWRTVDPIGLVVVREKGYLLALEAGSERTLRVSRILTAEQLAEPAQRPDQVDLAQLWADRCAQFLSEGHVLSRVRVSPDHRDRLVDMAEAVRAEAPEPDGWLLLDVTFQDLWHAEWALWQLGRHAEVFEPQIVRAALCSRATELARRYQ